MKVYICVTAYYILRASLEAESIEIFEEDPFLVLLCVQLTDRRGGEWRGGGEIKT